VEGRKTAIQVLVKFASLPTLELGKWIRHWTNVSCLTWFWTAWVINLIIVDLRQVIVIKLTGGQA